MRFTPTLLALLCVSALPLSALAQDSVSKTSSLPGDALDAHDATEQLNDYIVDQTAFTSTWGKVYGIAPIAKASRQRGNAPLFYTSLINAQALSRRLATNVPFLRSQYSLWNGAGFGVNNDPARSDAGTPVSSTGMTGFRFGFGFAEFADGDPAGTNLANVVGGLVNFQPNVPSRLYVARVIAGSNAPTDGCSLGAFGVGGVDEDGDIDFRADNFGSNNAACPTFSPFTANNLLRVDMSARAASVNVLSSSFPAGADAAATTWALQNSTVTHNAPSLIPRSIATRPIIIGSNFNKQYVFEGVAGSITAGTAAAHLAGLADHRGAVGYSTRNYTSLFPGSVNGTGAIIAGGTLKSNVAIWGLDATGNFLSPIARALPTPAAGLDPDQPTWAPSLSQEFDHYHSQTAFQGGSAQIALGRDQAGNLLAAGVVYYGFTGTVLAPFTNPNNYLAVSKTDPLTGTTAWTAAAWTDATGSGKNIYQNGTTVIGHLRAFGTTPTFTGPTISGPMIDSVGNVWFLGSYELGTAPGTVNVGLFRSVLQTASFSYKLELVLTEGQVFLGRNSTKNYKVNFLTLNDTDSISSGTAFSGNIAEVAFKDQSTTGLATDDARTLGGIVISAEIVYDNDGDGQFVKSTGTGGTVGSPDEDYKVLLYVSASADCNGNGIPDDREIADGTVADSNANGIPDSCEGILGLAYCFGDGTGTQCPCGNNSVVGSGQGCLSSLGVGAKLSASGFASLANDTAVLTGVNMPNSSALYFQGTTLQSGGLGAVFGDGLRCAGGSVIRLKTVANLGGASAYPSVGDLPISIKGLVGAPGVRTYQIWYRNAANFCTVSTFNLSNGIQITWTP
jgi:hypothetical protein